GDCRSDPSPLLRRATACALLPALRPLPPASSDHACTTSRVAPRPLHSEDRRSRRCLPADRAAMSASSTSLPCVSSEYAFSTQVASPPFLNRLPFEEEMTTGLAGLRRITVGPCATAVAAIAAAPLATNERRVNWLLMRTDY